MLHAIDADRVDLGAVASRNLRLALGGREESPNHLRSIFAAEDGPCHLRSVFAGDEDPAAPTHLRSVFLN